jgi:nucleoside diphosphate kinase
VKYPNGYLINEEKGIKIIGNKMMKVSMNMIEVRKQEEFRDKSFYLHQEYDWVIVRDSEDVICLIPTEKGGIE